MTAIEVSSGRTPVTMSGRGRLTFDLQELIVRGLWSGLMVEPLLRCEVQKFTAGFVDCGFAKDPCHVI